MYSSGMQRARELVSKTVNRRVTFHHSGAGEDAPHAKTKETTEWQTREQVCP